MKPVWKSVTDDLQHKVGQPYYDLWIRPLKADSLEGSIMKVTSPNEFHLDFVQRTFFDAIQTSLASASPGTRLELTLDQNPQVVIDEQAVFEAPPVTNIEQPPRPKLHPVLNSHYTFENFVVGTSNQVAHASALSVAQHPGTAYNPLFLVGGSGLGKTHLLHAIGHAVYRENPKTRIFCLPAERFMNEFVSAIQRSTSMQFKEKYRTQCDLLLIDDIHTLQGREATQEEFFHIFNSLHEQGKQIVLTSDKYPRDMPALEARLRSRFEWGLIADIQPPEMETRVAIIRRKAEMQNMEISDDVAVFLATLPTSSVRDLEGYITRLRAFSKFQNTPIDLEFARTTLSTLMGSPKVVGMDDISRKVADFFAVRVPDMKSKSRKASITEPRHVAMYIARELTGMSFPEIGKFFSGRNHATVIHACENVRKRMLTDAKFAAIVNELMKTLQ